MAALGFLKDFKKNIEKMTTVSVGISKPNTWFSSGNYALNKTLSGSYFKCIPEGRITAFCGASGSGKTFLSSNIMKQAQKEGAHLLILDTENAIDIDFLERIGVKTDEEHLTYIQVGMIEDVNAVFSDFFAAYEKEHGNYNYQAPKVLAVIDSLAMLSTITETENYEKRGEIKGDQGQRAKRTKAMLRMILSRIAKFPITVIVTDHVYPQDVMLGDGPWAITNSTKFFPSIIGLISKLKLKEDSEVVGIRMRVEAYKTRFAMTGGKVELEVPYTSGMSPYSGLLELLEEDKVVSKAGAWYSCQLGDELIKFQKKQLDEELVKKLLSHPIVLEQEKLVANAMESISEPEIDEINQTEELSEQE